jgi:hypothetical protein
VTMTDEGEMGRWIGLDDENWAIENPPFIWHWAKSLKNGSRPGREPRLGDIWYDWRRPRQGTLTPSDTMVDEPAPFVLAQATVLPSCPTLASKIARANPFGVTERRSDR